MNTLAKLFSVFYAEDREKYQMSKTQNLKKGNIPHKSIVIAKASSTQILFWCFFIVYLVLGLFIFRDYGLSWDEHSTREIGLKLFNYAFHGDESLFSFVDRDYGGAFEIAMVALEKLFHLTDTQSIFYARHLFIFLTFASSVWVFYKLCAHKFNDYRMGALGALCLILSPRIFAESFYNSKDIVLLSFFIFSIYALTKFLEQPSPRRGLVCALVSALLIDIRLAGLIIPLIAGSFIAFETICSKETRAKWKDTADSVAVFAVFLIFFIILFWPFLWRDPVEHFFEALHRMSNFSSMANSPVFYLGNYFKASALPWHYIPTWLAITTPIIYSAFFVVGLFSFLLCLIRKKYSDFFKKDWLYFFWFFFPLFTAVFLGSVIYDGWRHFYFIYPAFLMIALTGLDFLVKFFARSFSANMSRIFLSLLAMCFVLNIGAVSYFMIKNHPYQNVYFNALTGGVRGAKDRFDLDYWGLSFRSGLEYIGREDLEAAIPITFLYGSNYQLEILPAALRDRFIQIPAENLAHSELSPKYVLANFRWNQSAQSELNGIQNLEIFSVKVDDVKIMSVYRLY